MQTKTKPYFISVIIALSTGLLSAFLTSNSMDIYRDIITPPLSPPAFLFPIVWTILYTLMGISSYIVYKSDSYNKEEALIVYGIQLVINLLWSFWFFTFKFYLFSFIWILLLIFFVNLIYSLNSFSPKASIIFDSLLITSSFLSSTIFFPKSVIVIIVFLLSF